MGNGFNDADRFATGGRGTANVILEKRSGRTNAQRRADAEVKLIRDLLSGSCCSNTFSLYFYLPCLTPAFFPYLLLFLFILLLYTTGISPERCWHVDRAYIGIIQD